MFLFFFRLPLFIFVCFTYFAVLQWFPIGSLGKKASLWCILGVPSIWWIDLQIDGVRKGCVYVTRDLFGLLLTWLQRSLSRQQQARLPGPGSIIASSFTSPIDAIYLAAIFDPIFTASFPNTRQVEHISLLQAILRAFAQPRVSPPPGTRMVDVSTLLEKYPNRPIVTFPECTTTNSRGILPLSHSLLGAPPQTKIFPVSLRYTPVDVVTPLPGTYLSFLWTLLSRPTHCIRVRVAESVVSGAGAGMSQVSKSMKQERVGSPEAAITPAEKGLLDNVGEALARLGRVKRVGLGVKEKQDFVRMWTKTRRTW